MSRVQHIVIAGVFITGVFSATRADLIARWEFNEGAGSIAYDSAGSYTGTLQSATWTTDRQGQAGKALQCGVSQWLDVPDTLKPSLLTVACWIFVDSFGASLGPIVSSEKGAGADGFAFRFGYDTSQHLMLETIAPSPTYGSFPTSRTAASADALVTGQWHHVAGTYDGQTVAVYVDGALAGSNTFGPLQTLSTDGSIPVGVGHLQGWGVQWFQGRMDDLQVYDNALTSGEIASLIPEPSSAVLCGASMLILFWLRRRQAT
jgi:hypothetical protein